MHFKAKNPALLIAALPFSTFSFSQIRVVNVTIDASKTGHPISPYIYGQFLEHIAGIVNNGIWADAGRPEILLSDHIAST